MKACPGCGQPARGTSATYCSVECRDREERKRYRAKHKARLDADRKRRADANKSTELLRAYVRELGVVVYEGRPLKVVRADGSIVPGNSRTVLIELLRKENIGAQGLSAGLRVGPLARLLFALLPRDRWLTREDVDQILGSQESPHLLGRAMVQAGFVRPARSRARWHWFEWEPLKAAAKAALKASPAKECVRCGKPRKGSHGKRDSGHCAACNRARPRTAEERARVSQAMRGNRNACGRKGGRNSNPLSETFGRRPRASNPSKSEILADG